MQFSSSRRKEKFGGRRLGVKLQILNSIDKMVKGWRIEIKEEFDKEEYVGDLTKCQARQSIA